jgi:hypothetical protein
VSGGVGKRGFLESFAGDTEVGLGGGQIDVPEESLYLG